MRVVSLYEGGVERRRASVTSGLYEFLRDQAHDACGRTDLERSEEAVSDGPGRMPMGFRVLSLVSLGPCCHRRLCCLCTGTKECQDSASQSTSCALHARSHGSRVISTLRYGVLARDDAVMQVLLIWD